MVLVIDRLKEGRVREAGAMCLRILEDDPGNADALHFAGVLAHKVKHHDEAILLIRRSLDVVPDQADWHSNLGIALQATGDFEGAIAAFQRAIELQPAHANAHANLGVLLRVFRRLEEAEASYRRAIELDPNNAGVYHNLAILLDQLGRTPEALEAFCKAITLNPKHPDARYHLAFAYSVLGERDKAIAVCEEWVARDPDNPRAHHALAAYSGRNVPARAADDYVQTVFDDFAEGFEAKLARLDYCAPSLVAGAVAASGVKPERALEVLDIGCGTGLCGPMLAPYARHLIGVDLSNGMLEHARQKQVYDELVHAELTAYLQQVDRSFDVIVTADTLVYFGALDAVIAAAASVLRPGGVLVFTVEEDADGASDSYCLRPHGRYTHRAEYVERLLSAAGLEPTVGRAELRKESGRPVAGLVVTAKKQVGAHV
jgi:predicted TPR repeat methyltransferase